MPQKRLNIVAVDPNGKRRPIPQSTRHARRLETQAKFDRMWLVDPEQFNPLRNAMERERLDRTFAAIKEHFDPVYKLVADLGCGSGVMSRRIRDAGASIHAVDISNNALKILAQSDMTSIQATQDYVPRTTLTDESYDLVISTELIAWLPSDDYRLYMAELARLVKGEGWVVCSTAVDIDSEDALQRFAALAETEFTVKKWILSYHRLSLRLWDFFDAPRRFFRASQDPEYREQQLKKRHAFSLLWFRCNSSKILGYFWFLIQYIATPIAYALKQWPPLLNGMEKISRFLWNDAGITHAIFIAKRRPLIPPPPEDELPIEPKGKRQVWE